MAIVEGTDLATDVLDWYPLLDAAVEAPLDRAEVEDHLGVSKATSYRVTDRLVEHGLLEESDAGFECTEQGRLSADAAWDLQRTVQEALQWGERDRDRLADLIRLAPALAAFGDEPLDRRDLERRLDVSKTTSYRYARALRDAALIEKSGGRYERSPSGDAVVSALSSFATTVRTARTLAPVLEAVGDATPEIPIEAFADATVTAPERGDAYSQVDRFTTLVQETDTLRGIDLNAIVPLYIHEIMQPVVDGMKLETIDTPDVVDDTAEKYPYDCVKLCVNGNITPWVHDDLPFGLAIFDDRVGIGVQDSHDRRLRVFVDTDSDVAHRWAERVFESYRRESVRLERFTKQGLREALPRLEIGADE